MSNFDDERFEYRDKVGKQKEAIANLLALSERHSGLFSGDVIKQLSKCKEKCEKLYNKLDKNEFEIAIVGLEKAGKSTFGNALMENRILPDADERCTYTSTCIRYGNDRAVVKFFSPREMDNVLRGYLETLGIENAEAYTFQGMTRSQYISMYNKIDQRDRDRYENTVNQDILNLLDNKNEILTQYVGQPDRIFEGEALYEDEFKAYIVSPKVAVAVKEVSIESSRLGKLQNAVIYDVPGFDSPTSMHLEQTKKRMKEADAIMLIASAEKPSMTAPALNMIQEVVDEDNVSLSDKLFIFGNRADAANTLGKNIQTLKNEALRWKLLSTSLLDARVIVGSAKAHLQAKKLVEGDFCVKKVEDDEEYRKVWGHGDGIQFAYDKLVAYNENERFPIIKNKIAKNNGELEDIFRGLRESVDSGFTPDFSTLFAEMSELKQRAREDIKNELEKLRHEIRTKYNQELILSKRLQEEVIKLFSDEEKYAISEDDITNAELKIEDVSGSVNVEKVEEDIREEKFNRIYSDFSRSAFFVAQNDHAENYKRIVDCFEAALDISKKGQNYDKLHGAVVEFVERYKKKDEDEFIYQSIIERFVRDLVEVLIRRPYTSEARLNKFVDEAEVFSGLVMFYNPGDANEGYRRTILSVAPKNQPLLLSLVFHAYKESEATGNSVVNYMESVCKGLMDNPAVLQLAFSVLKLDPIGGFDAIRKVVTKGICSDCKTVDDYARKVVPLLHEVRNTISNDAMKENDSSTKRYDFDFSNRSEFERQYKRFFGNQAVRTYDNVREFFAVDLKILENFLVHASIPAIRLEKPFVSREVQAINKLLEAVKSGELERMIDKNSKLLLPNAHNEIDMGIANSVANKAAMAEVDKILKTLSNNNIASV